MKSSGWSSKKIILLWTCIALLCALATPTGFSVFSSTSQEWLYFIQAFAGGTILMMLANSMIAEAYEHGGKLAGVFTVFDSFFLYVWLSLKIFIKIPSFLFLMI